MENNIKSIENLEENLRSYNRSLDTLPLVLQFNKRDAADPAPVTCLNFLLNRRPTRAPVFESSACNGRGVTETLNAICKMAMAQ